MKEGIKMNNTLTKGQIINSLMENLPVVNPFEIDSHLLDVIEGTEDIAFFNRLQNVDFINDCHDLFCE